MTTMLDCTNNCTDCHRACLETAMVAVSEGGRRAASAHVRLLLDCAQICATSADFMTRGSPLHRLVCGLCAEICTQCAVDCEAMAGDDEEMRECAETCRRCAASCREMAS